jgi:hypothetical protein
LRPHGIPKRTIIFNVDEYFNKLQNVIKNIVGGNKRDKAQNSHAYAVSKFFSQQRIAALPVHGLCKRRGSLPTPATAAALAYQQRGAKAKVVLLCRHSKMLRKGLLLKAASGGQMPAMGQQEVAEGSCSNAVQAFAAAKCGAAKLRISASKHMAGSSEMSTPYGSEF